MNANTSVYATDTKTRVNMLPGQNAPKSRLEHTLHSLFKAVSRILETSGEDGLSTDRIASASGISVGSLYRRVRSKAHLINIIAEGGQKLVLQRMNQFLHEVEIDPHRVQRDPIQIIHTIVKIFVTGFGKGNSLIDGKISGRSLIRLAWSHEDIRLTEKVANHVDRRLTAFLEQLQHPDLPPPSSATMFVIIRVTLAVLRYASLERSPLLGTNALEDGLTQTIWMMFKSSKEASIPHEASSAVSPPERPSDFIDTDGHVQKIISVEFEKLFHDERSQSRGDQTERHIFRTLSAILEAEGPEGLKAKNIASKSGFSLGTIYQYFPNKEKMMWITTRYGGERMLRHVQFFESGLLVHPEASRQLKVEDIIRGSVEIYTSALLHGQGFMESGFLSHQIAKNSWKLENTKDTIALMDEAANSIHHFWLTLKHPGMSRPPDPTYIFIVTRGLTGTARSAILESTPLLNGNSLDRALLQMCMVLTQRI